MTEQKQPQDQKTVEIENLSNQVSQDEAQKTKGGKGGVAPVGKPAAGKAPAGFQKKQGALVRKTGG